MKLKVRTTGKLQCLHWRWTTSGKLYFKSNFPKKKKRFSEQQLQSNISVVSRKCHISLLRAGGLGSTARTAQTKCTALVWISQKIRLKSASISKLLDIWYGFKCIFPHVFHIYSLFFIDIYENCIGHISVWEYCRKHLVMSCYLPFQLWQNQTKPKQNNFNCCNCNGHDFKSLNI